MPQCDSDVEESEADVERLNWTTSPGGVRIRLVFDDAPIVPADYQPGGRRFPGGRRLRADVRAAEPDEEPSDDDICGFCGEPGGDKIPHPVRWPGESSAGTELVHAECEQEECRRAHAELSDEQRREFLRTV